MFSMFRRVLKDPAMQRRFFNSTDLHDLFRQEKKKTFFLFYFLQFKYFSVSMMGQKKRKVAQYLLGLIRVKAKNICYLLFLSRV